MPDAYSRAEAGYLTEPQPEMCECGHHIDDHVWPPFPDGTVCDHEDCDCTDFQEAENA